MRRVRARQQEPLDALIWRSLGKTAGAVEAALELNPGIDRRVLLPEGRAVRLPVVAKAPTKKLIELWSVDAD
jgi:phage tail protein X